MNEYFPQLKYFGRKLKGELNLCNYAAKPDLENAAGFNTSKFAKRLI